MILTVEDIRFILTLMREKYGPGYSDDPQAGALQAKLSIMLEMASKLKKDG